MITLLLIRHATTEANEKHLWIGHMESEISSKGRRELEKLKEELAHWEINECFVSPSKRTLETLEVGLSNKASTRKIKCEVVEALREIHFGRYEGRHFNWVKVHEPEEIHKMIKEGNAYCYPQGESLIAAHKRVAEWLEGFLRDHKEGTFLVCAHGGTIRSILSELLAHDESLHWHFKIDPASLTVVTLENGFAVIESLNKR
ncbi:MAG: histidine phosphatase family protein [Candidatus Cellulosilyticum pullistercoris]|uniref:Histidine phosphatase family protein n=1 Tax=Candidatus Cellulosilyticum pullistercoris TaxID=2838521 RepID=A0A9E2NLN5_9FIRM|nr:histidine phosphatase family protein [Candidatus Cellulosilyticum pullistercoris]